jgi:hypothetical protein
VDVTGGDCIGFDAGEHRLDFLVRRRRENDVLIRARRRVTAQDASGTDGGLEALEECEAVFAELLARPTGPFEESFALFLILDRLGAEIECEKKVLRVSTDTRTAELTQELDALTRLRPALRDIAEGDDQVGPAVLQVGECCAERDSVSVHVGDESDPHSAELMDTPYPASAAAMLVSATYSRRG